MHLEIYTNPLNEWEKIRVLYSGSFYMSSSFARCQQKQGNSPLYFVFKKDKDIKGLAVAYLTSEYVKRPLNKIFQKLECSTHPIAFDDNEDTLRLFCKKIIDYAYQKSFTQIKFNSADSARSPTDLNKYGMVPFHRLEFRINLEGSDQDVFSNMHHMRRRNLKKIIKSNTIDVSEENSKEGLKILIDLQEASRERRVERGENSYNVGSYSMIDFISDHYLQPGLAKIFLAQSGEEVLSAILLHCSDGRAYYTRAGSSQKGFEMGASQYLIWEVMKILRKQGYHELNLGGVSSSAKSKEDPGYGLYFYKASFGGREIPCTSWQLDQVCFRSKLKTLLRK